MDRFTSGRLPPATRTGYAHVDGNLEDMTTRHEVSTRNRFTHQTRALHVA